MKIMVSGSRFFARCGHHERPCGAAQNHRHDMVAAFGVHVMPLFRAQGPLSLWHGDAQGADTAAAEYWRVMGLGPVNGVAANWAALGNHAGHVRNGLLVAQMPELLVAFPWTGGSIGTYDAIAQARDAGIPTHVYPISNLCPLVSPR